MQKILPCELQIEFAKNQLATCLDWTQQIDSFKKIEYIKIALEEYFEFEDDKIKLHKFWSKMLWMDEVVEVWEQDGIKYAFIKLKWGNQQIFEDGEKTSIDSKWNIVYQTKKWHHMLEDFFTFIKFDAIEEDEHFLKIIGVVYVQTRWWKMIKWDIANLLRNIVYKKKPEIVNIETYLTKKDITSYADAVQEIEVSGVFWSKNKYLDYDDFNDNNRKKLKTGLFFRWWKWTPLVKSLKNQEIKKMFLKAPTAKAKILIWESPQVMDFDLDTLQVTMKQDTISTRQHFDYFTFKQDCLSYAFKLWETIGKIQ